MNEVEIPETTQEDYQVFKYWANGLYYKFRGEVYFSSFHNITYHTHLTSSFTCQTETGKSFSPLLFPGYNQGEIK